MGGGDKRPKSVVDPGSKYIPPLTSSSFMDVTPDLVGSNSVAGLFSSSSTNQSVLQLIPPPRLPRCLPMGLDLEIPSIAQSGVVQGTSKRRIEFDAPISSAKAIVLYAIPRSVVDVVHDAQRGVCEAQEEGPNTCEAKNAADVLFPPFGPQLPQPFGPQLPQSFTPPVPFAYQPPAMIEPPAVPALEALELRGDFIITRHYSVHAVGAGSLTVVRSEHGVITLIDAGVGKVAHTEISEAILAELALDVGDAPIAEVLITHAHEDHTSLLPELARKYRIGKIRINAYQHQDPRMLKILVEVARASAARIREGVTAEAEAHRATWEAAPERGKLDVNAETREAMWTEHVDGLVRAELARSAIKLETAFVDSNGTVQVIESPLLGELILPHAPGAPVLLERGYLESSSSTGSRITTGRPSIAFDLDNLIRQQTEAPPGSKPDAYEAEDRVLDANEATFVIDLGTAARLFVTPDKRAPNIESMQDLLEGDVARLNAELANLGVKKTAKLHVWNMSHHAQRGFVTSASQIATLVSSLHKLTRVKLASGARTMDIVLVSGQVSSNPAIETLVDPLTVWTLNEMGIDVVVATDKTVEVLEVLLSDGTSVAGVTQAPYKTGVASEGTLRNVEAALRKIVADVALREQLKPARKGTSKAEYSAHVDEIASLRKLQKDLKAARDAYIEYHEEKLRSKGGKPAPGIPPGDPEAAAKRAAIDALLADDRVKSVVEDAAAKTPVFDPVALTLMKRPPGGIPPEMQQLVDAILQADQLRQNVVDADSIDTRAEFAKQLGALRPLLVAHLEKAPPGTKEVLESVLRDVDREISETTKPAQGSGEVATATTPDGAFTVEQRTQFEKAKSTSGNGVRWFADKTTRPLGALMIYSLIKKQGDLKSDDDVGGAEHILGTIHSAYGISIGVRMLHKIPVSNHEFAILAVVDILETTSRHYASDEQRATAIQYSLIRNTLQVGLSYLGTWMMTKKNRYLAAAGFLIQFAVDPFLEWVGLYSWLEKKNDFLPDDVVTVRQRIQGLMSEYTVLIGLLQLANRENLSSLSRDGNIKNRIQDDISSYRSKVTKTEAALLAAFDDGYYTAKTTFAGLPELDQMRAQFLELQHLAHAGDTEHSVESRQQILAAFEKIEGDTNLDWLSDEAIGNMGQWTELDQKLGELEKCIATKVDWDDVTKAQSKLDQMLANARYRLDPGPLGLRTAPLLTPGSQAHATYEAALDAREARAANIHERLFGVEAVPITDDPVEDAITRADRAVASYATALAAMPPFVGLSARQLKDNSFDLAKTYLDYVSGHDNYRGALHKLEATEQMLKSTVMRLDALAVPIMTAPMSSTVTSRVDAIHEAMTAHTADRITSGFLFVDEAKQRAIAIRETENADIAKKLGETNARALSTPERMAIIQRELPVSTSGTTMDLLNAMPMLARVGADGYMVGVYRYVGWDMDASKNALVGDLRRSTEVADVWSDADRTAHLFVPLNKAASELHLNHGIFFIAPILGRSPFADVPTSILEFDDDQKNALQRVKFEELTP